MTSRYSDDVIRAEYADEEAAAAREEIAAKTTALSVRVPAELADALKRRAARTGVSVSTYARQALSDSLSQNSTPVLTEQRVEDIARRVIAETQAAA